MIAFGAGGQTADQIKKCLRLKDELVYELGIYIQEIGVSNLKITLRFCYTKCKLIILIGSNQVRHQRKARFILQPIFLSHFKEYILLYAKKHSVLERLF